MTVGGRLRILPLLVIVAFLSFAVRIGDLVTGWAMAQEETTAHAPPMPAPGAADDHAVEAKTEEEKTEYVKTEGAPALPPPPSVEGGEAAVPKSGPDGEAWKDAGDTEFEFSDVKDSLYKDLAKRREELDAQEKELGVREALLKAGERELEQKLRELTSIRGEIEGLLKSQTDEEKARIDSLVKIYEGMKAKDAARIFNTLDMDVLISVMTRMSERKSAAILAEMNADRARNVTILMAQQKQMPSLPAQ